MQQPEAVSVLAEMFPTVSTSELLRCLSLAAGSLNIAAQHVLECMDSDDEQCSSPTEFTASVFSHSLAVINPLESRGNYSATSNNMTLVHWPLMGGPLHLVQRGGYSAGLQPTQAPVPNVTAQSSTVSIPVTVFLYNGPVLCGFNVSIKG